MCFALLSTTMICQDPEVKSDSPKQKLLVKNISTLNADVMSLWAGEV